MNITTSPSRKSVIKNARQNATASSDIFFFFIYIIFPAKHLTYRSRIVSLLCGNVILFLFYKVFLYLTDIS